MNIRGAMLAAAFLTAGAAGARTVAVWPGDALQDSLDTLGEGDTLFLSPGTYTLAEQVPILECSPGQSGVTITSSPSNRAVLDGQGLVRPVVSASGPNASRITLSNLVITGGNATGGDYISGGGVFCQEAWTLLTNCHIYGNSALIGGGIGAQGGTLSLHWSEITENEAQVTGGGVDLYACMFQGFSLLFENNTSSDDGAGLNGYQSWIDLSCALFTGNSSGDDGGGLCILQGTSSLEYLTVHGNNAFDDGGGLRIHTVDSLLLASSIVTSNTGKAGINVISAHPPVMVSVCCWNNEYANYNGVEDPTGTQGNISMDPVFADSLFNLSHLEAGQVENSPCLDGGHQEAWGSAVAMLSTRTDSLPDQGTSDMGWHHVNASQSGTQPDASPSAALSISPSPVRGSAVLTVSGITGDSGEARFFDLSGRLLLSSVLTMNGGGTGTVHIPAGALPRGTVLYGCIWRGGAVNGKTVVLE